MLARFGDLASTLRPALSMPVRIGNLASTLGLVLYLWIAFAFCLPVSAHSRLSARIGPFQNILPPSPSAPSPILFKLAIPDYKSSFLPQPSTSKVAPLRCRRRCRIPSWIRLQVASIYHIYFILFYLSLFSLLLLSYLFFSFSSTSFFCVSLLIFFPLLFSCHSPPSLRYQPLALFSVASLIALRTL